jgi:hypothetical protein
MIKTSKGERRLLDMANESSPRAEKYEQCQHIFPGNQNISPASIIRGCPRICFPFTTDNTKVGVVELLTGEFMPRMTKIKVSGELFVDSHCREKTPLPLRLIEHPATF